MIKAIKITFISIIAICIIAILAGYIALTQIDFNHYKETIIKIVRNSTGRELSIGDIQVKASFNPTIELRNVTFANAEWAKEPIMLKADSIDLEFAVIPLLHKNIVIDTFKLSQAELNLEETADGKANWNMQIPDISPVIKQTHHFSLIKSAQADENQTNGSANILSSLVIKHVALENVKINYTNKTSQTQTYDISYLNLDENINENIDFKFDVNKGLYAGSGVLGALNLIDSAQGYPVQATLNIMGITATANITLFDALKNLRFEGNITTQKFLGNNNKYNEKADISLKGNLQNINAVLNELNIANNIITGTADINLSRKVPTIKAALKTNKIDLNSFKTKTTANLSLIRSAQATTLVPPLVIPYSALYSVNANVDTTITQLTQGTAVLAENLQLNATVNNGNAIVKILKGKIANGAITSKLELNAANKTISADTSISQLNLQTLMKTLGEASQAFNFISGSNTDIHIKLTGKGNTYAEVVDSLDGQTIAIINKSKLHVGNINILKGNIISQLLNTLNIAQNNDDLDLRCAVVRADIKNGDAQIPSGIVLNADKFTLVANGNINLKNDKINLSIKPFAGKLTDTNIAKALSSLVKLTGTIQNPQIGVDGANALKTIVGVTTTGPVYLGAQMLLENDGSPCYTALQGTGYESMFPKPENVIQSTTGDVGQILNDSVGIVKDTTKGLLNILSGGNLEKNSKKQ